jgi:hypothetical protein
MQAAGQATVALLRTALASTALATAPTTRNQLLASKRASRYASATPLQQAQKQQKRQKQQKKQKQQKQKKQRQ